MPLRRKLTPESMKESLRAQLRPIGLFRYPKPPYDLQLVFDDDFSSCLPSNATPDNCDFGVWNREFWAVGDSVYPVWFIPMPEVKGKWLFEMIWAMPRSTWAVLEELNMSMVWEDHYADTIKRESCGVRYVKEAYEYQVSDAGTWKKIIETVLPGKGRYDYRHVWNVWRLMWDLDTKKYVLFQANQRIWDLTDYSIQQLTARVDDNNLHIDFRMETTPGSPGLLRIKRFRLYRVIK